MIINKETANLSILDSDHDRKAPYKAMPSSTDHTGFVDASYHIGILYKC